MRWPRDLRTGNKTRAQSAARSLRNFVGTQNGEMAIRMNRLPDNCGHHHLQLASIRLRASKHLVDASSPEVRCFCPDPSGRRKENTRLYQIGIDSELT